MKVHRSGKGEKSLTYFDLLDACDRRGCPVCRLLSEIVRNYIKNLLYENVNDPSVRSLFRNSLGACSEHATIFVDSEDAFGIAIIYQDILQNIHDRLSDGRIASLRQRPECPVCSHRQKYERLYIGILCDYVHDQKLQRSLEASDGLCLNHLSRLIGRIRDVNTAEALVRVHEAKLGLCQRRLAEFVRKQDIQFRHQAVTLEEQTACERAIDILVGKSD